MEQENTPEIAQVGSFRTMFYSYSLSGAGGNFSLDPELLKLTGFQASFFKTPHSLSQIFHPEDRPSLEEALSKAMKGEKSAFEVRIRLPQGTYLKAENILIPILENENIKRIEGGISPNLRGKAGRETGKKPGNGLSIPVSTRASRSLSNNIRRKANPSQPCFSKNAGLFL